MVVVVTAAGRGVELGHIQAGQELPVDGWNTIHTIHTIHTTKFTDTRLDLGCIKLAGQGTDGGTVAAGTNKRYIGVTGTPPRSTLKITPELLLIRGFVLESIKIQPYR
ncbi:hypothetical protein GX50_06938 [[Emmonsia] crescens]|uniref:Uncharacterized protein n=1 Tax=[Emmonsia] crescens TaxID=73230 RepID=A0A2B7ZAA2_9EURO|nr:hypothetical protein GX50_06938 [Emmonsia crescens]